MPNHPLRPRTITPFRIERLNEAYIVYCNYDIIDCYHHVGKPFTALEHIANQNCI